MLLWVAVAGGLVSVVRPAVRWFTRRTKSSLDDKLVAILGPAVFFLLALAATRNSLSILAPQMSASLLAALFTALDLGLILLAGYVAFRVFKEVVLDCGKRLARRTAARVEDILIPALDKLGAALILAATLVAIAARAGVDLSVLPAGGAFAGPVVGLAAQESLANLFAGLHIIFDRPFKVGDTIELESGEVVDVREVGLRSCKLFSGYDGSLIIVPNQVLARSKITNFARLDKRFRLKIEVAVAYAADPDRVLAILKETVAASPEVLSVPGFEPVARLSQFGESALTFDLLFWIKDHTQQRNLASDARIRILKRLKAEGVEIPFPQRVVTLRGGGGAEGAPARAPAP